MTWLINFYKERSFGETKEESKVVPHDLQYPDDKTLAEAMQKSDPARLEKIKYAVCANGLEAIQFVYSDGTESPVLGGKSIECENKLVVNLDDLTQRYISITYQLERREE